MHPWAVGVGWVIVGGLRRIGLPCGVVCGTRADDYRLVVLLTSIMQRSRIGLGTSLRHENFDVVDSCDRSLVRLCLDNDVKCQGVGRR